MNKGKNQESEVLASEQATVNQKKYDEEIRILERSLADVQKPETLKRSTGRNLVGHAELVFDILDGIKDLHPYIGVATFPFRATLKIILAKQDNDKRIAALVIEMIDMMSALIELRHIKDTGREMASGETIESNLTWILTDIKVDIEDVGNVVDSYSKARAWHRVLHVRDWAEKFKDMAENFQRKKSNIQVALNVHVAVGVEALDSKFDHVLALMQDWFEHPQSADERRLLDLVKQDGGQKYLDSEADFVTLYKKHGSGERSRESASSTSAGGARVDDSRDTVKGAKEEWEEIKQPLTTFLSENRSIFEAKLDVQKRDLITVMRQSETTIIRAINDGPYSYITHPDIRYLWRAMNWRLSVKTRHFVTALHDHYLHGAYTPPHRVTVSGAGPTDGEGPRVARFVDPTDKWCLQYLRVRYLPAISEAFDDDGSGFIGINEVNDFTDGIPKGWNLLKWVTYWTGSWPMDLTRYSRLIQETMVQLAEAQHDVRPENIEYVNNYMNGFALSETRLLVTSVQRATETSDESELSRLAAGLRSQTERYLEDNLQTVKYNIDDPDILPLLCGPGRIEKYLFPLLHILLVRHLKIIRFSCVYALDSGEMDAAYTSLYNVLEKVYQRVEELKESFRQQKLDVNEHFKGFACGIYSRYQYSDASKGIGLTPQPPDLGELYNGDSTDSEDSGSGFGTLEEPQDDAGEPTAPSLFRDSDAEILPQNHTTPPAEDQTSPGSRGNKTLTIDDRRNVPACPAAETATPPNEKKSQTSDPNVHKAPQLDKSDIAVARLGIWHIYFPCDTCKSGTFKARLHCPNVVQNVRPEVPAWQEVDPTRYGRFYLETGGYEQPLRLTEDTVPWRPLGVQFSGISPREMLRLTCHHVLERVQLLSPRLTWTYLQRRRFIRSRWIDIGLRSDEEYVGGNIYKDRSPSNEEELADLKYQITPEDHSYFNSLAQLQIRLRAIHRGWFCDGCNSEISGKRFMCLDCLDPGGFDLCDECEHREIPRHNVTQHPPSHSMMQLNYPVDGLARETFRGRARKYLTKHSKRPCPCCVAGSATLSDAMITPLCCGGCRRGMWNEVHLRCLQCLDYDLCEGCERAQSSQHCKAHVLLKLKAPFLQRDTEGLEDSEDEEQPLSVETRLTRLTKRMVDLETTFTNRLDEVQKDFKRVISLLEQVGMQEKKRTYLYESTKTPGL